MGDIIGDLHVTQLCSFNWQALLVRQFTTHYQVIKVGGGAGHQDRGGVIKIGGGVISKSERDT